MSGDTSYRRVDYQLSQNGKPGDLMQRSSWWPRDLTAVLDGTWKPPVPTVGCRSDGLGLCYRGRTHAIVGESEAGKGWGALGIVRSEIEAGHHVTYLDFEDDEA